MQHEEVTNNEHNKVLAKEQNKVKKQGVGYGDQWHSCVHQGENGKQGV